MLKQYIIELSYDNIIDIHLGSKVLVFYSCSHFPQELFMERLRVHFYISRETYLAHF